VVYTSRVSKVTSTIPESAEDSILAGDRLLTVTEVANGLSVNRLLVVSWITGGSLPALDLGSGRKLPFFKVKASDLRAFIASREVRAGAARARVEAES
jgi:excisionase family DNA binding protein